MAAFCRLEGNDTKNCIFGLPERAEGLDVKYFLKGVLPSLVGLTFSLPLELQRAQRLGPTRQATPERQCPITACSLHHEQVRKLSAAARTYGPYDYKCHAICVTTNFSQETNDRRKAFLAHWPDYAR
ncbi:hypothetical protein NDU88_004620 [Pleurodeles waltl]|uniref:Uncharacterized protein n=1 Tax=Pleurodeles waltl TaxID=8319 RepID=A0AAV7UFM0_PLEWA|nr:hypothetical protein NDU88_004620 [Pleurodeles waltl]